MGKEEKKPKIQILQQPRQQGSGVHIRVRFNYSKTSAVYGFNIPNSQLQNEGDLEKKLKELYEEYTPTEKKIEAPTEIDW